MSIKSNLKSTQSLKKRIIKKGKNNMKKNSIIFVLASFLLLAGCTNNTPSTDSNDSSITSFPSESSESPSVTSSESSSESSDESPSVITPVTDTFNVLDADLFVEEGHAYFSISGQYNNTLSVNTPKLIVRNGDDGDNANEGAITLDAVSSTYSAKVDLSNMSHDGTWYDVKFYLDSTATATGEVMKDTLPDGLFDTTISIDDLTVANVTRTYGFKEYSNFLKLVVTIADTGVTAIDSIGYTLKNDGVYFVVSGTNNHTSPYIELTQTKDGAESIVKKVDLVISNEENNPFEAEIKVSDWLLSGYKTKIVFGYTDALGNVHSDELTNKNVANFANLSGVSYGGLNYVFKCESWETTIWFKLVASTDIFSVDTLKLATTETGVNFTIQGTLNITSTNYEENNGDLALSFIDSALSFPIALTTDLDTNGYLVKTVDIKDIEVFPETGSDDKMAIEILKGTTQLGKAWINDWSHHDDVLGPVTFGNYTYTISTNKHWGEATIVKAAVSS